MILLDSFKDYILALTNLALDFWYLAPVITVALVGVIVFDKWKEHKSFRSSIYDIDTKEIVDFKNYLYNVIVRLGYIVEWARHKDDHKVNMVAVKDGVKVMFCAIRNQGNIGYKSIQESLNVAKFHECNVLIMVTNKHFTLRAKEFASVNGVILWDRDKLIKYLLDTKEEDAFKAGTLGKYLVENGAIKAKHVLTMDEYLSKKGE